MGPALNQLDQRKQAVEQAKAQLASIMARTKVTTDCIAVLVEAGQESTRPGTLITPPLITALCKVQLAQLRMAEAEGLAAIHNLTEYIRRAENPLYGATLIPPGGNKMGRG